MSLDIPTDDFPAPEDEYKGLEALARAAAQARMDAIAYEMDRTYGAKRTAERLGVSTTVVNRRRNRHKERIMPRTITVLTPQGGLEVSREWERVIHQDAAGETRTWMTRAAQTRRVTLVPVREGAKTRWALKWTPADEADADLKMQAKTAIEPLHRSTDPEQALRDATLWLHENPLGPQPKERPARPDSESHTVNLTLPSGAEVSVVWQRRIYPENLGGGTGPWRAVLDGDAATVYEGSHPGPSRATWDVSVGDHRDSVTAATVTDALKEITHRYGTAESPTR